MNSDATTGFFNEAFALPDFGAAAAAGTPATGPAERPLPPAVPAKKGLMQEIEETQAGKEPEVELSDKDKTREHFLTCNLLWSATHFRSSVLGKNAFVDEMMQGPSAALRQGAERRGGYGRPVLAAQVQGQVLRFRARHLVGRRRQDPRALARPGEPAGRVGHVQVNSWMTMWACLLVIHWDLIDDILRVGRSDDFLRMSCLCVDLVRWALAGHSFLHIGGRSYHTRDGVPVSGLCQ